MQLTVRLFGFEVLHISDEADEAEESHGGPVESTPLGFIPFHDPPSEDPGTNYPP